MPLLTMSGNEITDPVRAESIRGDGLATDGTTGIWTSATNLCPNGGFETNTTGWVGTQSATISRDATRAKFGSASLKIVSTGISSGAQFANVVTGAPLAQIPYWASVWVFGDSSSVGKRFDLQVNELGGAQPTASAGNINFLLAAGWQRATVLVSIVEPDRTGLSFLTSLSNGVAVGDAYWLDGAQLENQFACTPFIPTDGGSATRGWPRVQMPPSGLFTSGQGWIAARLRMGSAGDTGSSRQVFRIFTDASNLIELYNDISDNRWHTRWVGSGVAADAFTSIDVYPINAARTVISAWDATNASVSLNGANFVLAARGTYVGALPALFDIGTTGASALALTGNVQWLATGSGTLSNANAATINGYGNQPALRSAFPGTCTALWGAETAFYDDGSPAGTQIQRTLVRVG